MSETTASTPTTFERRPYTGSCHCGTIKYIAYLALPTSDTNISGPEFHAKSGLGIYKCNCTVCNKMGIFHMRLRNAPEDFQLLTPADPNTEDSGMTSYQCNDKRANWYFCKTCGVRCFTSQGAVQTREVDVPVKSLKALGLSTDSGADGEMVKRKTWGLKPEGWEEHKGLNCYFSLNAVTLTAEQEGLDLSVLHEKGWLGYVDSYSRKEKMRVGKPHYPGIY